MGTELFLVYRNTYIYKHGVAVSIDQELFGIYFDEREAQIHASAQEDFASWGEVKKVTAGQPLI